jgi:predicted Zn-dependent protease
MNLENLEQLETAFNKICQTLLENLQADEHLFIELDGEQTQFVRFNNARVRQTGIVNDGNIKVNLIKNQRTAYSTFPFSGDFDLDYAHALDNLENLRNWIAELPADPYLVLPENNGSTRNIYQGSLLAPSDVVNAIIPEVKNLDFTGIYASGSVIRAHADSSGQKHWFATDSFLLDYSLITTSEKAIKGIYAGQQWHQEAYKNQIANSRNQLITLDTPAKKILPGQYPTYFAPAATADLFNMLSWGAISEASLQQGGSALRDLRQGKKLSSLVTITENFSRGIVPRFNELGEIAPEVLPLIKEGELVNTLINSRTAKEYHLQGNGATIREGLRSGEIAPGNLKVEDILKTLDTGLYLSNLHYLNWSDQIKGRITGMTRYACFWVESGELVAPIENLRFDESLYNFWGENLHGFTDFQDLIPATGTYGRRQIGGCLVPGMLVDNFCFTL